MLQTVALEAAKVVAEEEVAEEAPNRPSDDEEEEEDLNSHNYCGIGYHWLLHVQEDPAEIVGQRIMVN